MVLFVRMRDTEVPLLLRGYRRDSGALGVNACKLLKNVGEELQMFESTMRSNNGRYAVDAAVAPAKTPEMRNCLGCDRAASRGGVTTATNQRFAPRPGVAILAGRAGQHRDGAGLPCASNSTLLEACFSLRRGPRVARFSGPRRGVHGPRRSGGWRMLADFPLLIEQEVRPANFQKPDNPAQTATIR
jgi:hypothetical protein